MFCSIDSVAIDIKFGDPLLPILGPTRDNLWLFGENIIQSEEVTKSG